MNWVSIVSGNGLSPRHRQAITWTNAGILSFRPLGTSFNEIRIKIKCFSFIKMHLNIFCPRGHELRQYIIAIIQQLYAQDPFQWKIFHTSRSFTWSAIFIPWGYLDCFTSHVGEHRTVRGLCKKQGIPCFSKYPQCGSPRKGKCLLFTSRWRRSSRWRRRGIPRVYLDT